MPTVKCNGIKSIYLMSATCEPCREIDTGKEPKLVAISMAAQLLMEAKKLAAR